MDIAKNGTCSTINRSKTIPLLIVSAVWFLASGCGRSNVSDSLEDEERDRGNQPTPIDAGIDADFDRYSPDEATAGSASIPIQPFTDVVMYPDVALYDAGWRFDATRIGDGADSIPIVCKENSECRSFNKCEIPVCTSSGICTYLPVEDGMPCYDAVGNQICLDGTCQYSSCGDGYLDTNAGEICDDGNYSNGDDCVNCNEATCGDGFLHQDDEECEPDLDGYCKDDCTLGSCGDGIVTSPAENCEPSIDGSACNDVCRLSDELEWKIEISSEAFSTNVLEMGIALLLDSAGQPIVVSADSYQDDDNISRDIIIVTKYDSDGEQLWQWASNEEDSPLIPSQDNNDSIRVVQSRGASIDSNDQVILSGMIVTEELSEMQLPWLVEIDSDGQLIWSTTLDQDEHTFSSVAIDDQSNIMVLMSSTSEMGYTPWDVKDPSIELFNPDGTYRADDSVAITGYFTYRAALSSGTVGDSSLFMLSGLRENDSSFAAFMALLDSNGEMVWDSPIYYADETENIGFLRALAASDGDIVVLGKTGMGTAVSAFPYGFWFERYGPDKTRRYEDKKEIRIYPETAQQIMISPSVSSLFLPMAVDGDNNVFFTYSLLEQIPGRASITIDKYDSDGEPVWERPLLYDSGAEDVHSPLDIAVSDQGSIYVLDLLFSVDTASLSLLVWRDPDHSEP